MSVGNSLPKRPLFSSAEDFAGNVFNNMPLNKVPIHQTSSSANTGKATSTGTGNSGGGYSYGGSYNRGGSSSAGSTASVAASAPAATYNPYSDWLAQQQAIANAAAAAKRQAAQQAYDRSMNALNGTYNSVRDMLQQNYNSSIGTMTESYNNGVAGVNRQADKTQNEAYINYMLSKRDLPQMMAAQGINGGAAESTLAGLQNNYGNSRNDIDVERNGNLTDLLQSFNANKASALQALNSRLADLENRKMAYQMQLEQALQEGLVSAANARYDALADIGNTYLANAAEWAGNMQDAAAAAAAATYTANNTPDSVSAQQGASGAGKTNYSLVNRLFGTGASTDDVISQMSALGYSPSTIQQMLNGYVE